jgi:hypothetical protein
MLAFRLAGQRSFLPNPVQEVVQMVEPNFDDLCFLKKVRVLIGFPNDVVLIITIE